MIYTGLENYTDEELIRAAERSDSPLAKALAARLAEKIDAKEQK